MPNIGRVMKTIILKSAVAIKIIETRKFLDVDDVAQHCFVVRKYNTSIIAISISCIDSQISYFAKHIMISIGSCSASLYSSLGW